MTRATLTKRSSQGSPKKATGSPHSATALRIGEPDDAFEREVDRTADEVMAGGRLKRHWSIASVGVGAQEDGRNRSIPASEAGEKLAHEQQKRNQRTRAGSDLRFRVPTTQDLKTLFTARSVPEDVLKNRVELALTRMKKEGRLKTSDSVADAMTKIFPSPGKFDEGAYEATVDITDRSEVYQSVLDAEAKVTAADTPKLTALMEAAGKLIDASAADDPNLTSVFGSKSSVAKGVYLRAKSALQHATTNIDSSVTTDYNLDDPETGLGGWARYSEQKVHFQVSVVEPDKQKDPAKAEKESEVTIVHEACHLADPAVTDRGYYNKPGFESADEVSKLTNAAHYEEIPRRKLGTSRFQNPDKTFQDFKPGMSGGAIQSYDDKVRGKADEYLRKAWDKAVDVAEFIRNVRRAEQAGSMTLFNSKRARILEISKLMRLTVHEQPPAKASVNQVDVVLAEGVAHAVATMKGQVRKQKVPQPNELKLSPIDPTAVPDTEGLLGQRQIPRGVRPFVTDPRLMQMSMNQAEEMAATQVVDAAVHAGGLLTGNDADDKKLVDWLVAEYEKDL